MVESRILPKDLSLTGHLETKRSPVRRYFDESFPKTRGVPKEVRSRLSGAAMIKPSAEMSPGELGLMGTAIDYRIRARVEYRQAVGRSFRYPAC